MKNWIFFTLIGYAISQIFPTWVIVMSFGMIIFWGIPIMLFIGLYKCGAAELKEKRRLEALPKDSKEYLSRYMPKSC